MGNNKKSFAYYCSDGASRILKFYSFPQNSRFQPKVIIYDDEVSLKTKKVK